ncbi:MAG: hypothetical protein AAF468_04250 [Pseudomonadota bacterium]
MNDGGEIEESEQEPFTRRHYRKLFGVLALTLIVFSVAVYLSWDKPKTSWIWPCISSGTLMPRRDTFSQTMAEHGVLAFAVAIFLVILVGLGWKLFSRR